MQTAIATATAALKQFQRAGAVAPAVPTPHRLLQSAGHAYVERSLSFVDVENADGVVSPVAVKGHRIRVTAGPFEVMVSRGALDGDEGRNRALAAAGRRYLSIWYNAGLDTLKGQDPGKIRTTAGGDVMFGSEWKCENFALYCSASSVLDPKERQAVDAIVLRDIPVTLIGRYLSGRKASKQADAVAIHELQNGLEKLAIHFGFLTAKEPDPIEDIMNGLLAMMDSHEAGAQ